MTFHAPLTVSASPAAMRQHGRVDRFSYGSTGNGVDPEIQPSTAPKGAVNLVVHSRG